MSKTVQFLGMSAAQAGLFTGLPRQCIVDTNAWALRVQDGVTPGGFLTLMAQNNFSDIGNIDIAKDNLELGTAADHDISFFDLAGAAATAQATAISVSEAYTDTHVAAAITTAEAFATAADVTVLNTAEAYADTHKLDKTGGTMTGAFVAVDGGSWDVAGLHASALGVGFTGGFTTIVDVRQPNNGACIGRILNTSALAASTSRWRAQSNVNNIDIGVCSSGYTAAGMYSPNVAFISTSSNVLVMGSDTGINCSILYYTNGILMGRTETDGGLAWGNSGIASLGFGTIHAQSTIKSDTSLQSAGTITAVGDITGNTSDIRLKTKIEPIEDALNKVLQLKGFTFNWNDIAVKLGRDAEQRYAGLSAQDVQKVQPEAIRPSPMDERYMAFQPEQMIPLLVEAIKILAKEIEELKQAK